MSVLGFGSVLWSPIILIVASITVALVVLYFRSRGQKNYKSDTEQTSVFLSGEAMPAAEQRHVRAHNIYWGFFESLKGFYNANLKVHTGIINDFILWFVALIALVTVIIFIVG